MKALVLLVVAALVRTAVYPLSVEASQSIVPSPKPGTILRSIDVSSIQDGWEPSTSAAPMIDEEGKLWMLGNRGTDYTPIQLLLQSGPTVPPSPDPAIAKALLASIFRSVPPIPLGARMETNRAVFTCYDGNSGKLLYQTEGMTSLWGFSPDGSLFPSGGWDLPLDVGPGNYQHNSNHEMVSTESGYIVVNGQLIESHTPFRRVGGVIVIDTKGTRPAQFLPIAGDDSYVTGLAAGRDGVVYATFVAPKVRGGIRGLNPATGQTVFAPNIADAFYAAPVITRDGTLYALGHMEGDFPRRFTLYAIATSSKGGPALSPWPRSTGDNMNSYQQQSVLDRDHDGLTDAEEASLGTDPAKADTDGDGYSDGTEVQNGSNPKDAFSIPDIMEAEAAIKLNFGTTKGQRYQIQSSYDLLSWENEGEPFFGTGKRTSRLVEANATKFYWRLIRVE